VLRNEHDAPEDATRVFKTRCFFKAAKKALIKDGELCGAMAEVMKGQTDDLGGGVFKKSLNRNKHRSIVLARGRRYWFYVYLFAKNDRENIDNDELDAFRDLADVYAAKTEVEITKEVAAKELVEICHDDKVEVQE